MKLAYGILATVALGLVLFVVTNLLGAREASATSSSGNGDDPWWDWPGYGASDNGDENDNGGWLGAVWDAGPGYVFDVWAALAQGAE